jgi:hypothetical protein
MLFNFNFKTGKHFIARHMRMASNSLCVQLLLLPALALGFSNHGFSFTHTSKHGLYHTKALNIPRLSRPQCLATKAVFLNENDQKEVGSIKMPLDLQEERLEADRVLSRATEDGKLSLKELEQLQQQEAEELQQLLEKVMNACLGFQGIHLPIIVHLLIFHSAP